MLAKPNKQTLNFHLDSVALGGAWADNADLRHIVIPANREVTIERAAAYVAAASDGADFIEVVKEDDTVLFKFSIETTGHKTAVDADGSTATTFPKVVATQSTSAPKLLKLKAGGQSDAATTVTVQLDISGL
jgi:hypothetical protein